MTVKELIDNLKVLAQRYGDNTEIVLDIDEGPSGEHEPFITVGGNMAGDPFKIRLSP